MQQEWRCSTLVVCESCERWALCRVSRCGPCVCVFARTDCMQVWCWLHCCPPKPLWSDQTVFSTWISSDGWKWKLERQLAWLTSQQWWAAQIIFFSCCQGRFLGRKAPITTKSHDFFFSRLDLKPLVWFFWPSEQQAEEQNTHCHHLWSFAAGFNCHVSLFLLSLVLIVWIWGSDI